MLCSILDLYRLNNWFKLSIVSVSFVSSLLNRYSRIPNLSDERMSLLLSCREKYPSYAWNLPGYCLAYWALRRLFEVLESSFSSMKNWPSISSLMGFSYVLILSILCQSCTSKGFPKACSIWSWSVMSMSIKVALLISNFYKFIFYKRMLSGLKLVSFYSPKNLV